MIFKDLSGTLYTNISRRLLQYVEGLGVPRSLCEDVVQDTWVDAAQHAAQNPGEYTEAELRSWLRKIAHSKAPGEPIIPSTTTPRRDLDARMA